MSTSTKQPEACDACDGDGYYECEQCPPGDHYIACDELECAKALPHMTNKELSQTVVDIDKCPSAYSVEYRVDIQAEWMQRTGIHDPAYARVPL